MIEVQLSALDATGRVVGFTMGLGRYYAAAVAAAKTGMRSRLAQPAFAAKVRTFTVEAV